MAAAQSPLERQLAGACRLVAQATGDMALALARRRVTKSMLLAWAQQLEQVATELRRMGSDRTAPQADRG